MSIPSSRNFPAQLAIQLRFLDRSCCAFDEGDEDEAVRIATTIRTIVHQTSHSTSLLRHLGAEDIRFLSMAFELPRPPGTHVIAAPIFLAFVSMGTSDMSHEPNLGQTPVRLVSVSEWWTEKLAELDRGVVVRRRDIALVAANKDGGAHVDSELTPEYERLGENGRLISWSMTKDGATVELPSPNLHYVALRTMGWELLNSPELRELAGKDLTGWPRSNARAHSQGPSGGLPPPPPIKAT